MKTTVHVHVALFVNKDNPNDTFEVIGDGDITGNSFEGMIFNHHINVTGLWKAIRFMESEGHKVVMNEFDHEIEY